MSRPHFNSSTHHFFSFSHYDIFSGATQSALTFVTANLIVFTCFTIANFPSWRFDMLAHSFAKLYLCMFPCSCDTSIDPSNPRFFESSTSHLLKLIHLVATESVLTLRERTLACRVHLHHNFHPSTLPSLPVQLLRLPPFHLLSFSPSQLHRFTPDGRMV